MPEQKENNADNKKPYKNLKLASGIELLSSFSSVRMEDYQFIIGHEARFLIDNDKIDYSDSCLLTNSENNQKFNLFYLFQIKVNYACIFWLHNIQCIIKNVEKYFQDLKMAPTHPANIIFKNNK